MAMRRRKPVRSISGSVAYLEGQRSPSEVVTRPRPEAEQEVPGEENKARTDRKSPMLKWIQGRLAR